MRVIDISDHQKRIDLSKIKRLEGVIIKASEGLSYKSPSWKDQFQQAQALKMPRGLYHFAGSSITKRLGKPIDEFNEFYSQAKPHPLAIRMLDWEPYGFNINSVDEPIWVNSWANASHNTDGVWPIIYMDANHVRIWDSVNPSMARQVAKHCPLLLAGGPTYHDTYNAFGPTGAKPMIPSYWNLFGWQYTSYGHLNGFGPLDLDDVYTDRAGWRKIAKGDR